MKTAPATFQRMMRDSVLKGLERFADAYMDDIEIDTVDALEDTENGFVQHLMQLREVFDRLRKFRLHARPSKCNIGESMVDFVGHRVGRNSIKPRDALVETIDKFPRPETKKNKSVHF